MEETQEVVGSAETGSPSRGPSLPSGKLLLLYIFTVIYPPINPPVLHHLHPLAAEVADGACNVHNLLQLDLVQDSVDGDQSPRPAHTSTVRVAREYENVC